MSMFAFIINRRTVFPKGYAKLHEVFLSLLIIHVARPMSTSDLLI